MDNLQIKFLEERYFFMHMLIYSITELQSGIVGAGAGGTRSTRFWHLTISQLRGGGQTMPTHYYSSLQIFRPSAITDTMRLHTA